VAKAIDTVKLKLQLEGFSAVKGIGKDFEKFQSTVKISSQRLEPLIKKLTQVNGKTVLTYTNLRYGDDGRLPENMIHKKDQKLSEGYISLQSESHPIKFRNIRIKSLN